MRSGFSKYQLDIRVLEGLSALGFTRPTPVQAKVIPAFLQKRNLIVEAPTGTGKTAAYGVPLISKLNLQKRSCQALVLAPTRELVQQIAAALQSFYSGDMLKVGVVYGGSSMKDSIASIKATPHIMVAVPGRFKDVMAHTKMDFFWRDIKYFIMDEGDKLMEMGFQKDYDAFKFHLRTNVQQGFFSATISSEAEEQIKERLGKPDVIRLHPKEVLKNIRFTFFKVKDGKRSEYLGGLIRSHPFEQALIFCSRREEVQATTRFLRNCGYKAESYYGSQEQAERQSILARFREKHIDFLVASDLAARGLDIIDLPAVINLAIPRQYDYYLHRVGRTGRAGNTGAVYNFVRSEADEVYLKQYHQQIGLPVKFVEITPVKKSVMQVSSDKKWTKYHISRGKKDKVRKGDIAGFLIAQAGLSSEDVGTITLYDTYSLVDLPAHGFETLNQSGEPLKIKGKSIKIRPYGLAEQEKRAKAVKKLKRDRK